MAIRILYVHLNVWNSWVVWLVYESWNMAVCLVHPRSSFLKANLKVVTLIHSLMGKFMHNVVLKKLMQSGYSERSAISRGWLIVWQVFEQPFRYFDVIDWYPNRKFARPSSQCQYPSFGVTSVKQIFAINCQSSLQPKRTANDLKRL